MKKFLFMMMAAVCVLALTTSCGDSKDEPNPDPSGPTTDGNDPVGTIALQLSNTDSSSNPPVGKGLYMDSNNNFVCKSGCYICSYGSVKGLAYVSTIPTDGWVTNLKVSPGYGYVFYSANDKRYYRIYVVDYRLSLGGSIIGADIKYQAPFCGVDETIELAGVENGSVTFPSEGTVNFTETNKYAEFFFSNPNLVTFTCEIEPKTATSWLTVEPCSTFEDPNTFLKNGIRIKVEPTDAPQQSTATIVLKTGYDKITTLSVTRSGRAPFIEFDENVLEDGVYKLPQASNTKNISVSSNIDLENIQVTSSQPWCNVELVDAMNKVRSRAAAEGLPVSRAANELHSYILYITPESNNGAARDAKITLTSVLDNTSATLNVTQAGATLEIPEGQTELYCNRFGGTFQIPLSSSAETLSAKSNQSWCGVAVSGRQLIIRVEPADINRKATITFPGFDDITVTVDQSKYAVGDTYSEGVVEGVVCYMEGSVRYVRSEQLGIAAWSTENIMTGAINEDDGKFNTDAIISLAHALGEVLDEWYPAFALVSKLNTNTTGWYLPSKNEVKCLGVKDAWSSTQETASEAWAIRSGSFSSSKKSSEREVYAIRKF